MPIVTTPETVFGPNYAATAETLTFTFENTAPGEEIWDMPEITSAFADADTGDIRAVVYGILEKIAEWYEALPSADRPVNMRISRSGTLQDGVTPYINRTYSVVFRADAGGLPLLTE